MCGLAGQVHWHGGVDMPAVEAMVRALAHRGPDDHGMWRSLDGLCCLGHRRLSIIDLSPSGHQPMLDPLTGNALVFNGEIYNYQSLRRECEGRGDTFRSDSDTEVILALYRRYGTGCLQYLRGMFAIALWDAARQRLFLARDRVGKKPLNYALTPDGVVFASEIDPLARHPAVSDDMDVNALELYLQLQSVPAPWTIYRAIHKLRPAHFAVLEPGSCRIERYWNVDYRNKAALSDEEALDAFEEKLTEAVKLRMIADVPLGALLSGGVDSSVVVALMTKLAGDPVRTFSIGFDEQKFNELGYAKQAANICGTQHHPEIVKGDVEHLLGTIARHYGEPFADSSAVPSFHLSQVARRHVSVVLNGDGGDELLAGYSRYAASAWSIACGRRVAAYLGPQRLVDMVPRLASTKSLPARVVRRLLLQIAGPEVGGLMMYKSYWNDHQRAALLCGRGDPELLRKWRGRWVREAFQQADEPIDRMLWLDNHTYLPDDLLVKMDIAAMHCGLEARSPLLDHEVIEFCARLRTPMKVRHRTGKYLLKKLAERYFPPEFVHRPKMGFGIPAADWLRGPLRAHAEAVILDPSIMAPLDVKVIRDCWTQLVGSESQASDHASRVWALLMYGQWRLLTQNRR